jgi:hypothetical protein
MKQLLLYSLSCVLLSSSCKKQKPVNPIDQLPAATQEGKNTFGCLVNGKAFLPKGPSLSPILSCYYQYLNTSSSKGYFFGLSASDRSNPDNFSTIGIFTDSLKVFESSIISLTQKSIAGKAYGQYGIYVIGSSSKIFYTNSISTGQLRITKLDSLNQIVSGTFWFNAVNSNGDTFKVTDGRFDVHYTR